MRTLLCALLVAVCPTFTRAQSTGRQELRGHIPEAIQRLNLQPLGRLSSSNHLHLAIGLSLHDPDGAKALIQELYDPSSPRYHQYLTTEQFAEEFGPTADDYQAAIDFATAHRFTVTRTYQGRLLLDVDATVADVETAFQVRLFEYQHPTEHRRFYAPDVEPSVPSGMKILDISGLSSYPSPHPNSHIMKPSSQGSSPHPDAGSILGGQYIGKDFRAAYVPGSPLTGAGQSVALVQFDNYYPSDITNYVNLAGLSFIPLTNIFLDSYTGTIGGGNGEVSLDIEMVISMAPGVSKIYLYEGNPLSPNFIPNDVLQRIADDNNSKQISCSWGWNSGPTAATDNIFIEMASHGQSFFVASGDSAAYPGSTVDNTCQTCFGTPAASPYVTSVGGTMLSTAGPASNWTAEAVWNWFTEFQTNIYNGVGSSGGFSSFYSIPSWQQGVKPANLGSRTGRNFPDVAMTGDHVFVAYGNGTLDWFGGTSCASPLWAGFTALVNQQGAFNGKPPVGFLNPAIYTIGTGTNYASCFHDVTSGNNEWSNSPSAYTALSGFDLCTGWGSPTGTNLINALVGPPTNAPAIVFGATTVTGGNGNGVIDSDECNLLGILLQNIGGGTATTVNATLTTTTPGVTITQPMSSYPDISPFSSASNSIPFQISTSPSFVCQTPISLALAVSYAGGSATDTFTMATCACPDVQIIAGLTAASPTQTGRLTRNNIVSACNAPKSCPGNFANTGAYAYQAYSFTNTTSGAICVTVTLTTSCVGDPTNLLDSETYLGSFQPNSLCSGYLADLGNSPSTSGSYSFSVPANTNFTVVVNAINVGARCSGFTLDIAGLPCLTDGGGSCAAISANFNGTPTIGTAPLLVTFTDTSSGTITNRLWNFGDSVTTNTTTNTVVHTYAAGTYTVSLIASGLGGVSTNTKPNYITALTPFQAWQIQYFGSTNNPNAATGVDANGTGQNNLFKYVAGLDPTNPASIFSFQVAAVTNQVSQDNLLFNPLASGRTYTPQFNTDLVNGAWAPLTSYLGPVTNGNQVTITDTNAVQPNKFYRLDISLP